MASEIELKAVQEMIDTVEHLSYPQGYMYAVPETALFALNALNSRLGENDRKADRARGIMLELLGVTSVQQAFEASTPPASDQAPADTTLAHAKFSVTKTINNLQGEGTLYIDSLEVQAQRAKKEKLRTLRQIEEAIEEYEKRTELTAEILGIEETIDLGVDSLSTLLHSHPDTISVEFPDYIEDGRGNLWGSPLLSTVTEPYIHEYDKLPVGSIRFMSHDREVVEEVGKLWGGSMNNLIVEHDPGSQTCYDCCTPERWAHEGKAYSVELTDSPFKRLGGAYRPMSVWDRSSAEYAKEAVRFSIDNPQLEINNLWDYRLQDIDRLYLDI